MWVRFDLLLIAKLKKNWQIVEGGGTLDVRYHGI